MYSLIHRLPPRSTLFPYTTLFRSLGVLQRKQAILSQFFPQAVLNALEIRGAAEVLTPKLTDVSVLFCDLRGFSHAAEQDAGDRKSTRLNSSHVEISYAVFCLKKKK